MSSRCSQNSPHLILRQLFVTMHQQTRCCFGSSCFSSSYRHQEDSRVTSFFIRSVFSPEREGLPSFWVWHNTILYQRGGRGLSRKLVSDSMPKTFPRASLDMPEESLTFVVPQVVFSSPKMKMQTCRGVVWVREPQHYEELLTTEVGPVVVYWPIGEEKEEIRETSRNAGCGDSWK